MGQKLLRLLKLSLALGFLVLSEPARSADYPAGLVTEAEALLENLNDGTEIVLIDTRPQRAYEKGHIPGAVWIDVGEWKAAFESGEDGSTWGARLGALGVTPEARVVVYDDGFSPRAARSWWLLRYWGITRGARPSAVCGLLQISFDN